MKKIITVVLLSIVVIAPAVAQVDSQARLKNLVVAYLGLKEAMIKESNDSIRYAAKRLYYAIDIVPAAELPAGQHKAWNKYSEKVSREAKSMKDSTGLDYQREHFAALSVTMFNMLKALNINTTELYYQYCPMANDHTGLW